MTNLPSPIDAAHAAATAEDTWLKAKAEAEPHGFFAKLNAALRENHALSRKQWACVEREMATEARAATFAQLDWTGLKAKLDSAVEAGLKKPAVLLGGYRFSLAPTTGGNAGWIYAKQRGDTDWGYGWAYLGKVNPKDGKIFMARGFDEDIGEFVSTMAELMSGDIDEAIKAFGRKTGACSCCGRELTEAVSLKSGIGPVCAARYGIDREAA